MVNVGIPTKFYRVLELILENVDLREHEIMQELSSEF